MVSVIGSGLFYNRYYEQHIAYRVQMGTLPDNQESRVLLLNTFAQALRSNRTAKYVGMRWTFSSGKLQGRPIEIGFDRTDKNGFGYVRFFVYSNRQSCGTTEASVLHRIAWYLTKYPSSELDFEQPMFWDNGCFPA